MNQKMDSNITFLEEAKDAVTSLEAVKTQRTNLVTNEKRIEKLILAEEKSTADEITRTVKKRREAVSADYDKQIVNVQERLKKQKNKREQARTAGMKERIKEETSDLTSQIHDLEKHFCSVLQQDRAPKYCYRNWFFTFFMTQTITQWLIVLVTLFCLLFALPYGIYYFSNINKPMLLSGLHFFFFVLVMVPYFFMNSHGKYRHYAALKTAQNDLNQIRFHKKKIKVVASSIKKDRNDQLYDLSEFNYEIAKSEAEIEEIVAKKNDALSTFDAVTKRVISDELMETGRVRINELKAELAANASALSQTEENLKVSSLRLTDKFSGFIPKEYMTPAHIDQLILILKNKEASSISEAVSVYQTKRI